MLQQPADPGTPRSRFAWRTVFLLGATSGLTLAAVAGVSPALAVMVLVPLGLLVYLVHSMRIDRSQALSEHLSLVERNAELEMSLSQRTDELLASGVQLSSASAKIAELDELKSAFVSGVTHELRTPLNAIIGFSEMLSDDAYGHLEPKQQRCAESIHGAGKELLGLVGGILDFSRVERGDADVRIEDVALGTVLSQVQQLVEPLARNHEVDLAFEVPADDAEPARADPALLQRILWNLLTNAIKFTPAGGRVTVTATRRDDGVAIAVRDTGVGIAADQLDRIFHDFYQVDGARSRQHGGTGLGLALVKRYADLLGASLCVESEPGQGARFEVILPPAVVPVATETCESAAAYS